MSERGLGCYVYCVVRAGECGPLEGVIGVDGEHGLEQLTVGELTAVVSRVPLEEFGAEGLKRNLEDLAWLERTALTHNAILGRACSADAVVPFRTCTIFEEESRVVQLLERERAYFLDELKRLRHRDEWGVKLLANPERLKAAAGQRHPTDASTSSAPKAEVSPGRAFFARKKLDRDLRSEAWAAARDVARKAHADLRAHAQASILLPPQDPRVSGRSGDMILNGAYLVERSVAGEFGAVVTELREREAPNGFTLELSGPFVPYNFVTPRREER